jgi:hypothetical protein
MFWPLCLESSEHRALKRMESRTVVEIVVVPDGRRAGACPIELLHFAALRSVVTAHSRGCDGACVPCGKAMARAEVLVFTVDRWNWLDPPEGSDGTGSRGVVRTRVIASGPIASKRTPTSARRTRTPPRFERHRAARNGSQMIGGIQRSLANE